MYSLRDTTLRQTYTHTAPSSIQNNPEAPMSANNLCTMFTEQIKGLQEAFTDTIARQEARHREMIESLRKEFEETRRNPPSATPSPQPVPTGIDPQTPGGKNASGTGSSTNSRTN